MIDLPPGTSVVLASASPRRLELLRLAGIDVDVHPADIDESARPGETPAAYVARLSQEKAAVVAESLTHLGVPASAGPDHSARTVLIAADTTVDIDGRILEKPRDADDARRMLGLLSGETHLVHTGVTVSGPAGTATCVVETAVRFVTLESATIDWYVATGEPFGKAGAYAIQGSGGSLVERVDGSVTNVIGLPVAETLAMLGAACAPDPRG